MKIGEFSKASGLPVSVLRYYDECGLLSCCLPSKTQKLDK